MQLGKKGTKYVPPNLPPRPTSSVIVQVASFVLDAKWNWNFQISGKGKKAGGWMNLDVSVFQKHTKETTRARMEQSSKQVISLSLTHMKRSPTSSSAASYILCS
jgi:hypothetical protein